MLDLSLGHWTPGVPESLDPEGTALDLFSFTLFARQLLDFFKQNDLPTVWVEDWFAWEKVCILYGEEVRDTPLEMTRKNYGFKYLRKVVITSFDPSAAIVEANPGKRFFGLTWQLTLNDGHTFKIPYTRNFLEPIENWKTLGVREAK